MNRERAAELAHCPRCGASTARLPDGECSVCAAQAVGEAERAERERRREEERARLGLAPLARSIGYARYGLEAADERLAAALRFALTTDQGRSLEAAREHVRNALEALR